MSLNTTQLGGFTTTQIRGMTADQTAAYILAGG
jgi:hypothetical protein